MQLQGKRALVTGATSGIGMAAAVAFAEQGARVVATGRNKAALARLRERLGANHLVVEGDVTNTQDLDHLFNAIDESFGGLEIVFANAGMVGPAKKIENISEEMFDSVFDLNVRSVFFTIKRAIPLLQDGGSIILNASIAPRMGRQRSLLYAASKAAVRTMARNISAELAHRNIRCNAISPGPIDTPLWDRGNSAASAMARTERGKTIPLGRFGTVEEVADLLLFLASDASRYIAAADIVIDGGLSEIRV